MKLNHVTEGMDVYPHLLDETAELEKDKAMKALEAMPTSLA